MESLACPGGLRAASAPIEVVCLQQPEEESETEDVGRRQPFRKRKRENEEESESDYSAADSEALEHAKHGFVCTYSGCGKVFNSCSKLGQHRRTHTGEVRKTIFALKFC